MISDRLLRVDDVSIILKVSPLQVIEWCDSGHLPCTKVGGSRRIKESDLDYILPSECGPRKLTVSEPERPIYDGPPADECGFEDDEEERKRQFKEEWEAAMVQIEAIKAKRAAVSTVKAPEPVVRGFGSQSTGRYPSGFDTF